MRSNIFLKNLILGLIPKRHHSKMRYIYNTIRYFGLKFRCPCCNGSFYKFLPYGTKLRENAMCPRCGAMERHRLLWMYLKDKTNFFKEYIKLLYIAPIPILQERWKSLKNIDYVSADINSSLAMIQMDITNIQLPDNQFDCIICNRVLEHISDDMNAMRELYRVLKPGGWAIIQVPILREKTFEDPTISTPEDRKRVFGEYNHVRIYGLDYKNRLEQAGFIVKVDLYVKELADFAIRKYGLPKDENIYFCSKPE